VLAILSIGLWALPTVWIFTGLSHSVFTLNKGVCQLGPESNWNTLAFICILKTLDEDLKFVGFRQPAPLRSLPFSFANFDNNLRPMTLRSSQIRTGRQCYVHNRRQIGCSQAVPASFALVCAQRLNFFASHPNFELMKAPISSFISSCRHNQSSRQKESWQHRWRDIISANCTPSLRQVPLSNSAHLNCTLGISTLNRERV
jgi:hypothetical protein